MVLDNEIVWHVSGGLEISWGGEIGQGLFPLFSCTYLVYAYGETLLNYRYNLPRTPSSAHSHRCVMMISRLLISAQCTPAAMLCYVFSA